MPFEMKFTSCDGPAFRAVVLDDPNAVGIVGVVSWEAWRLDDCFSHADEIFTAIYETRSWTFDFGFFSSDNGSEDRRQLNKRLSKLF